MTAVLNNHSNYLIPGIRHTEENSGIFGSMGQGKKIFMNGINSLVGHSVFEEIRNDHIAIHSGDTPNLFFASINEAQSQSDSIPYTPVPTIKILDYRSKPKSFRKNVLQCDLFIIDLMSNGTDLAEIEFLIKLLKSQSSENYQKDRTIIIISTVMTWASTPKRFEQRIIEYSETDTDDDQILEQNKDQEEGTEQKEERKKKRRYKEKKETVEVQYEDKDYKLRIPLPKYQSVKNLEQILMACQKTIKNLKVFTICAGLPYGNGEANDIFYDFFRRSWLNLHKDLATLPIIGDGKNIVPTIHVKDLANCVKLVINNRFKQSYFIAIDQGKKTQKKIIKSISKSYGHGKVKSFELSEVINEDWSEYLQIDLKMKVSAVFKEASFWHCKKGINKKAMHTLNNEFNQYRGLQPLKILIQGPPASGKSALVSRLAERYSIPLIKIEDLIQFGYNLDNKLGKEIHEVTEELKNKIVADYEKTKKKKDPELDRSQIKVRLPDKILQKLLKIQISQPQCINKGFILDGFPKTFQQAHDLFLKKRKDLSPDHEQQDPSFSGYKVKQKYMPSYFIVLEGDDLALKQRIKEIIPSDKIATTHYTDQAMDRRLKVYREFNTSQGYGQNLQDFFERLLPQNQILQLNCFQDLKQLQEESCVMIEQNGKPCSLNLITEKDRKFLRRLQKQQIMQQEEDEKSSYLENEEERGDSDIEDDEDNLRQFIKKEEERAQQKEYEQKEKIRQIKLQQNAMQQEKLQEQKRLLDLRLKEIEILDTRTQPIKQYLMDNVVSDIMQGLVDLCHQIPSDPVDFLADYLLKKADELDQQRIQEREAEIQGKLEAKQAKRK